MVRVNICIDSDNVVSKCLTRFGFHIFSFAQIFHCGKQIKTPSLASFVYLVFYVVVAV